MKVYIVALMALLDGSPIGLQPPTAFIFTSHVFSSVAECKTFARVNSNMIMTKLWSEFGADYRPHMISCVDESVVKEIENTQELNI